MAYPGQPIINPPMPCRIPVQGICHGKMIFIQGHIPHGSSRWHVNLATGPNPNDDVAMHFNPRFEGLNQVIRNHFQGGHWGQEERSGRFPFRQGMNFEMIILVQNDCFKVAVNGTHYCEFRHRFAKERVNYILIEGSVNVQTIRFEGGAPPPAPGYSPYGAPAGPAYNPPVPYMATIPGGMHPGRSIQISGIPSPNPERFTINLKCGAHGAADIALHFDARFRYGDSYNVVVRNSQMHGGWQSEERHASYFPFIPNANFDIQIYCEQHAFKVAVNNQHFIEFTHRVQPIGRIDTLEVTGDLRLTQVRI